MSLAAAVACGGESEAPKPKPAPTPAPAPTPTPDPTPTPTPAPPADAGGDVAEVKLGDADAGRKHYETLCASCHGARGAGDGPVSATLNPKPAAHNDGGYMNELSNEHLFKVIKLGGPAVGKSPLMAPWGGSLSDEQIRDVIAFVRSLAVPPYPGD